MPPLPHSLLTLSLLALGLAGGLAAQLLGLPLPFLLGSLLAAAPVAIFATDRLPKGYDFPVRLRVPFIGLIGAVIGAQVSPALLGNAHLMLPSLAGMALFSAAAMAFNYTFFHRVGGYDRATALFAGAPGGLIESIALGAAAGADEKRIITQQFLRIVMVIATVPLGLSLYLGYPVGSAAGMSLSGESGAIPLSSYAQGALSVALGAFLGQRLKLPAWQLTGPLLVSAAFALAGRPLALPDSLIFAAQVVAGTSLGMRFAGLSLAMLGKSFGLALVSAAVMLLMGALIALGLLLLTGEITGQPFDVLLITFAPGGVNEMALIALSIGANPAFVTLHHIFRIIITVFFMSAVASRLQRAV